jgi:hypothetical protein
MRQAALPDLEDERARGAEAPEADRGQDPRRKLAYEQFRNPLVEAEVFGL